MTSAITSATARAATICVRISGTTTTSPRPPHSSSCATNSWNCAARTTRAGIGPERQACSCATLAAPYPPANRSVPMIDTTTASRTPARTPAFCRLCAAVTKKSVAGCCSADGPVAASTTTSTPCRAASSPVPVITSTPVAREIGTTSWPRSASTSVTCRPSRPVAPATAIFMMSSVVVSVPAAMTGGGRER